jgi:hypothetical protein
MGGSSPDVAGVRLSHPAIIIIITNKTAKSGTKTKADFLNKTRPSLFQACFFDT